MSQDHGVLSGVSVGEVTSTPPLGRQGRRVAATAGRSLRSTLRQRWAYEVGYAFLTSDGILYDEYLPKVYDSNGKERYEDATLYEPLHEHQGGAASLSTVPCRAQWMFPPELRSRL